MTQIFAERSAEKRREGEALIREAENLTCQSWNEKMWSDGGPMDPSPTMDKAINGGYPWLELECSRCKARRDVDLCAFPTSRQHAFMISRHGLSVRNAGRPGSARRQRCSS